MAALFDYPRDDLGVVDDMMRMRSREVGCVLTLEDLVARWTGFVQQLDKGHRGSRREYEAGLEVRAVLAEIEECLSIEGRRKLLADLIDADRRFLALTAPTRASVKSPWWRRLPRDLAHLPARHRDPEGPGPQGAPGT